jgi:hypothetical protein
VTFIPIRMDVVSGEGRLAHDVLKLITVAAVLALVIGLVALFASGYISAFKPGGVASSGQNISGGASGGVSGGARSGGTVSVKAVQQNATMPSTPAGAYPYGEAPPGYVEPQQAAYEQPQVNMQQPAGQLQAPEYVQEPQPPYPEGNVSPVSEIPGQPQREVVPSSTPVAHPETPDTSQLAEEWRTIFDELFQILSLIFSRQYEQYGCIPQWPAWPQYYPVNLK